MRRDPDTLIARFFQFAVLSLLVIGGGSPAVPDVRRQTVEIARSLTDRPVQRTVRLAIAQAAPGPNIMFVALLGHFIAGRAGRRGRNGSDVQTELCPRLCGVAGCRTLSQGALAHCNSGRFGARDHWTYRTEP